MKVTLQYLLCIDACIAYQFDNTFGESVVLTEEVLRANPWFSSQIREGVKYSGIGGIIRGLRPDYQPHRGDKDILGQYCSECLNYSVRWLKNVNEFEEREGKELVL